jgi:hypothetical protein
MHVTIDPTQGTATIAISDFWNELDRLLAQADAHPEGSHHEDSGQLNLDRDSCEMEGLLDEGKPLWPLIERDIENDPALNTKLHRAYELRDAGDLGGEKRVLEMYYWGEAITPAPFARCTSAS